MKQTRQRTEPRGLGRRGAPGSDPPAIDEETVARLSTVAERLPHLIGVADGDGELRWLNGTGRAAWSSLEAAGSADDVAPGAGARSVAGWFTPASRARYRNEIRGVLVAQGIWTGDLELVCDGEIRVVEAVVIADTDADGQIEWLAMLAVDVAEQRRRVAELSHRASHDPLTGLPNRALLEERLIVARSVARRMGAQVALIALDLDGFKAVNDAHGHAAGDLLLQQVTARLSAVVRPADTVARYGGDEFLVVLHPPESTLDAVQVAQRMRDRLRDPPYRLGDATVEISVSVGLTVVDADDPADVPALLEAADRAMYRAKRSGGNRVRLANTATSRSDHLDQLDEVRIELVKGLDRRQFHPEFDPYLRLDDDALAAIEIVPVWSHPTRGRLDGRSFLEDAELTGHAEEIWWRIAHEALDSALAESAVDPGLPVLMPLTLGQLRDASLTDRLAELAGLAAGRALWLAVTEADLAQLEASATLALAGLIEHLGLGLALSGHGLAGLPLALLAELPLRLVTIDASLGAAPSLHPRAVALAAGLSTAGETATAADGVGSRGTSDVLAMLGVDWVKGPVTGGPVPADQLAELTRPRP